MISSTVKEHPRSARRLLLAGYAAQQGMLRAHPTSYLPPSRLYIAQTTMRSVRSALAHPQSAAAVSLFTPCEPLHALGITPCSVETLSAFLAGTKCEQYFLHLAEQEGFPDTLCSYHRIFLGALRSGLVPAPALAIYTTIACDGNMITFSDIHEHLHVPTFCIDVPYERSDDAVHEVAQQIKAMVEFIQDATGQTITHDQLCSSVVATQHTAASYMHALRQQKGRRLASDVTTEMYTVLGNHIFLGSPQAERFAHMLDDDMKSAPQSDARRLLWMHLMPNMHEPVIERLDNNDHAFITACDLATDGFDLSIDPSHPYEAMARRLVYSSFNGSSDLRIQRALALAEETDAQGAILFAHWGCKSTIGAAYLIQKQLEDAGLPCLVLDGDGCDRTNNNDGQTATRLDAFFEQIDAKRSNTHTGKEHYA